MPAQPRETRIGKDPVHFVGRRYTSPLVLTCGLGPPCDVHRMDHCSNAPPDNVDGTFVCEEGPPPHETARSCSLVLFLASFFAASLARQRFFYSLSFAGLQVERVSFYFFNDVLGLYLPLETAKRVFKRFTFLKSNFCQRNCTPLTCPGGTRSVMSSLPLLSQVECAGIYRLFKN